MMDGGSAFQFHKGTIRTHQHEKFQTHHYNFNSIKVQLELKRLNYVLFHISVFQFHKGTIRTYSSTRMSWQEIISIP